MRKLLLRLIIQAILIGERLLLRWRLLLLIDHLLLRFSLWWMWDLLLHLLLLLLLLLLSQAVGHGVLVS